MRRYCHAILLLPALLTFASCIPHRPVRTFDGVHDEPPAPSCPTSIDTSIARLQADTLDGETHRRDVSCVSHERHTALTNSPTSLPHGGFDLHVFELDDEGQPWNLAQQEKSFLALEEQLKKEPAVVVTFVHGWKNDATVCNGNISCFREVLEILSKAETRFAGPGGKPRRVVGVYIGWRGGTIRTRWVEQLTFWGRKHTAHTIGDNGAVSAIIERLRALVDKPRQEQRRERTGRLPVDRTSMVFVGHSFGAALLFSALATSLNADVGTAVQKATGGTRAQAEQTITQRALTYAQPVVSNTPVHVETAGDLVILVNPAMEASRFANLNQARNLRFDATQVPIFMTVASDADGAVGGFFPIGQAFTTLARSARSREFWFSMVKGFGLYEPYHTHRLALKPQDTPVRETASGTCRCKSNLGASGDALVTRLGRLFEHLSAPTTPPPTVETLQLAAYQETFYSRLEPVRDIDPNNPFIMASVDPAIIGGHSEIFNAPFMDFLIEFILRSEIKRKLTDDYGRERSE